MQEMLFEVAKDCTNISTICVDEMEKVGYTSLRYPSKAGENR